MKIDETLIEKFLSIDQSSLTEGKYSAKTNNFYQVVKKFQKGKLCEKNSIRPIQFTFEITNQCNCCCEHCGMSAGRGISRSKLNMEKLKTISDFCQQAGIPSYAITGGEPFLEFENMCNFIKLCRGKLDAIKLISNGFWGREVENYFDGLKNAGFFENSIFIPAIQLSIGEQDVPLEYICNIIKYVAENYSMSQLHLGIIFTMSEKTGDKLGQLYEIYVNKYGHFPEKRVFLTLSEYKNYVDGQGEKLDVDTESVFEKIGQCDNKFAQEIGKFVSPKIFMKVNGDCYPCEIFNMHKDVFLGNLFSDGIEKVLENYNSNKYIKFIQNYGTISFRDVITERVLKDKQVETPCMACEFCIKYCQKHNLIK